MTIRRRFRAVLMALVLLSPASTTAGEIVSCFKRDALGDCSQPVLQHVAFKSVVLQFVDPAETGLGESLSRLFWREILESISDLQGAGVILAYDRAREIERALGQGNLSEFLEHEYHMAASAIARQQNAQMSIWGAVLEDGGELFVQTFLTLREVDNTPWATLTLSFNQPDEVRLSSVLGRERLNLSPLQGTRTELFGRKFVTRCALSAGCPDGIALRESNSNDARIIAYVPEESQVEVIDMNRQWLKVVRGEDETAWINIYHVEVFPKTIEFSGRRNVNLRDQPGGQPVKRVNLDGRFAVINAHRFGEYSEPWYQIEVGGDRGWVAGRLVSRRSYTFPAVHLIAALYRYGRGQYERAQAELESFLASTTEQDNVTRSTALQFLAASRITDKRSQSRSLEKAVGDMDAAAKLTPFDSRLYTARAIIKAGSPDLIVPAMEDLNRALELDRRSPEAIGLLKEFDTTSKQYGLELFAPGRDLSEANIQLDTLRKRYNKQER